MERATVRRLVLTRARCSHSPPPTRKEGELRRSASEPHGVSPGCGEGDASVPSAHCRSLAALADRQCGDERTLADLDLSCGFASPLPNHAKQQFLSAMARRRTSLKTSGPTAAGSTGNPGVMTRAQRATLRLRWDGRTASHTYKGTVPPSHPVPPEREK